MKSVWIVVALLFAFASSVFAQPTISGPQDGQLGPGTYLVVGNCTVEEWDSWSIQPGTTLLFDGPYNITVYPEASMTAHGTEADSVKFLPNTDNGITNWGGIRFYEFFEIDEYTYGSLRYCLIKGASVYVDGVWNGNVGVHHCTISNSSGNGIGAIEANLSISYCTIFNNAGEGIDLFDVSPTITSCTIDGNGGDGIHCILDSPTISNTVISNNAGTGLYAEFSSNPDLDYSNVYNNGAGDFGGDTIDPLFGVIAGVNANGDSCDVFNNISMDPLYVDPAIGDYYLQEASPCIDAGDPTDVDPDGTVADIGAHYYYQENNYLIGPLSGTLGPGEYIVNGDLSIVHQDTLIIMPGTTLLFNGLYEFYVGSGNTLLCQGTETDSIKFMPNTDNGVTEWGHLRFRYAGDDDIFEYCLFTGGSDGSGGGINISEVSSPTFRNCTIRGNNSSAYGGGICISNHSNPEISFCTITDNTASIHGGGIHCRYSSQPTISSCTITGNSATDGAGIYSYSEANPTFVNTAVTDNIGTGVYVDGSSLFLSYCDVYNNTGGDFAGAGINPDFGVTVGTNANGDDCDAFFNISMDPLYVDPDNGDFHLQETSPCVDAGDPATEHDPDGTVADIGAFYYDQGLVPVVVTLTPTASTVIPTVGGTLFFDANIFSNVPNTYPNILFWTKVRLPNGSFFPPRLFQRRFTLTPYMNITGSLTQNVPAFAPAGEYEMWGWVGPSPQHPMQFGDFFPFTKSAVMSGSESINTWSASGEFNHRYFADEIVKRHTKFAVEDVFPNPFNPTTTITIALPVATELSVTVYNALGQQVAVLANGSYTAGSHSFTLDGSSLASGIYFVHASVRDTRLDVTSRATPQIQKIVLMK